MASGCSIDALGKIMREIDQEYQLGLFDRMKASFIENGEVKTLKLIDFKTKIRNGEISKDIQVFDFSKNTYLEFLGNFLLPFERSWAASIK
jgi:ATP:corrinoid adenosyltransferase